MHLTGRRPALLVVDSQAEFVSDDGAVGGAVVGAAAALRQVVSVIDAARAADVPVVYTQELHRPERVDFGRELDGDEAVHCIEGTPGADFRDETRPRAGEFVIRKRRYSSFFATDLDLLLRGLGVDTVIVCGFVTDVCVHYTCVDAHQLDYHVHVVSDAVAGTSAAAHTAALAAVEYLQSGSVVDADAACAALGVPATAGASS
jgi:biuret amidohydrolase